MFYEILTLPEAQEALFAQIRANVGWLGVRTEIYQPIVDRLSAIAAPTLLLWGKQDKILPVAHTQTAVRQLPNARLQVFDACGHWLQVEQAEAFNELVVEFLAAS